MSERYFEPLIGERPWDHMLIMKLIASIFLLASMVGFTYVLLNPNAVPGDNPGYGSIVFILIGALGIPLLLEVVQRILVVSGYSVDEVGIIVPIESEKQGSRLSRSNTQV